MPDEKEIQNNKENRAPYPTGKDVPKRAPGEPASRPEPKEKAPQEPLVMDEKGRALNKKDEERREPSIRTYEGDVAKAMKDKNASASKIALAEQKRRLDAEKLGKTPQEYIAKKETRRTWPLFLAILLVFLGVGVVAYSLLLRPESDMSTIERLPDPIIFSNEESEIDTTTLRDREVVKALSEARTSYNGTLGSIENIYLTVGDDASKRLLTSSELLRRLGTRASDALIRNLAPEMMYGVHAFDGNEAFFIFKIENFEIVFAQMLSWERDIYSDLGNIFYDDPERALIGTSTTTESLGNVPRFSDLVIKNRDSRLLRNNDGDIILLYAFPDRESLIISTNQATFNEILNRLTAIRFDNN